MDIPPLEIITKALSISFAFILLSAYSHFFQIKEYRFDRVISSIKEDGILKAIKNNIFKRPKLSKRNIAIFFVSLIPGIVFIISYYDFQAGQMFKHFIYILLFMSGIFFSSQYLTNKYSKFLYQRKANKTKKRLEQYQTAFIGITGSFGKSSVKEYLKSILQTQYKTASTHKNYNTLIGVIQSIEKININNYQYFITEMGAYKKGEISEICEMVKPKYAILTGLGNQHLSLFGSKENLVKAKSELFSSLPENGTAYINIDNENFKDVINSSTCKNIFLYSNKPIDITNHQYTNKTISFIYIQNSTRVRDCIESKILYFNQGKTITFYLSTKIFVIHNIVNLLPCIALSYDLGISKTNIEKAISKLQPLFGKLSIHKSNKAIVINDSYNSNVSGFLSTIELTKEYPQKEIHIYSRGIIELGDEKESSYKTISEKIMKSQAHLHSNDKTFAKFLPIEKFAYYSTIKALENSAFNNSLKNCVILLEGRFSVSLIKKLNIKRNE